MPEKRTRERDEANAKHARKKQKRGFIVGPPAGTYKQKTYEIKQHSIVTAKMRKEYNKLKKEGKVPQEESIPQPASLALENVCDEEEESSAAPHPDRRNLIGEEAEAEAPEASRTKVRLGQRRGKVAPFKKEYEQAQKRKAEAEERRRAREEADRQRTQKIEERERFRKAMAKARTGGRNGQRKLGRESLPLLEKVKRLIGNSG